MRIFILLLSSIRDVTTMNTLSLWFKLSTGKSLEATRLWLGTPAKSTGQPTNQWHLLSFRWVWVKSLTWTWLSLLLPVILRKDLSSGAVTFAWWTILTWRSLTLSSRSVTIISSTRVTLSRARPSLVTWRGVLRLRTGKSTRYSFYSRNDRMFMYS